MIDIALTFDLEWCPLAVVDWLLAILARREIRCTFFLTDTPRIDLNSHEAAVHPNPFRPGSPGMLEETARLLELYPGARGVRMHRLGWDASLETLLPQLGVLYTSTELIPNRTVRPFRVTAGLVHFPIFYMDHYELLNPGRLEPPFSVKSLHMSDNNLFVFDFHPNMLFTNAPTETFYRERVHPAYNNVAALQALRHFGRGCCTLFEEIAALPSSAGFRFITLQDAIEKWAPAETPQ